MAGRGAPTKLERQERISFARKCLVAMMSHSDAAKKIAKQYNVSSKTAHSYVHLAYGGMEKDGTKLKPYRKHQLRESLAKVFQKAYETGQLGTCVSAIDRLARLDNLYDNTITVENKVTHHIEDMSAKQRTERIHSLIEQYASKQNELPVAPEEATTH